VKRKIHAEMTEEISKTSHKYDSKCGGAERSLKEKSKRDSQERSRASPSLAKEKRQRKWDEEKRRR
jgi:hypothetical protein